jgi:hypothetical protein
MVISLELLRDKHTYHPNNIKPYHKPPLSLLSLILSSASADPLPNSQVILTEEFSKPDSCFAGMDTKIQKKKKTNYKEPNYKLLV